MNRFSARIVATLVAATAMLAMTATVASAALPKVVFDSAPLKSVQHSPSVGEQAYQFNHVGGEALLTRHTDISSVKVTLDDWATQENYASSSPTFPVTITLRLYRLTATRQNGEVVPFSHIVNVTKTFNVRFQPVNEKACPPDGNGNYYYRDANDGTCRQGINQIVTFPVGRQLAKDVVWSVEFNTESDGLNPTGDPNSPTNSLNVAFSNEVQIGSQPHPGAFWDTTDQPSGYTSFVDGAFNYAGNIDANTAPGYEYPAVKFVAVS